MVAEEEAMPPTLIQDRSWEATWAERLPLWLWAGLRLRWPRGEAHKWPRIFKSGWLWVKQNKR